MTEVFIHFNQSKSLLVPNKHITYIHRLYSICIILGDQHLIHDVKGEIVNLTHRTKTLKIRARARTKIIKDKSHQIQ